METNARYVWLPTTLYSDCIILIYLNINRSNGEVIVEGRS